LGKVNMTQRDSQPPSLAKVGTKLFKREYAGGLANPSADCTVDARRFNSI
jgi:hypothetical protein